MTTLQEMLDQGDGCSLLFLIAILCVVGAKMAEKSEPVQRWGWRLAAGAFIAYAVYGGFAFQPHDASAWSRVVLRGLLAGGLSVGISWIALTVLAFLRQAFCELLAGTMRKIKAATGAKRPYHSSRELGEDFARRLQEDEFRRARQMEQSAQQAEARRRRADARAKAALTFSLYAAKLQSRFRQEMFEDFLAKYMSDDQLPEDVERRGAELLQTLQKHVEEVEPPEQKRTLEDLARWFSDQKARIESLPVEEKIKRLHVAEITARYAELSSKLLEKLQP